MSDKKKTGADILLDTIYKNGVDKMFGLPGGAIIPIMDAVKDHPIDFILTRHEQGASHMADGYARATGKPGVILITSGPGATNTLTGIMTAQMDSVPMVIISGQQATSNLGLDTFQEADISGMSYPIVKHSYLITDPKEIPKAINEAFFIASTGRPGPVILDIPKDVANAVIDEDYDDTIDLPGYLAKPELDIDKIKDAAQMISQAQKPIFLVGHGAIISGADKILKTIVEDMNIPITNSLLGKGCFPEEHPLNLGMPGMHGTAYANMALCECDLVVSIGSRWDDRIAASPKEFCAQAKKIHIDIDLVEINKVVKVDIGLVGDAKDVLEKLHKYLEPNDTSKWIKTVNKFRKDYPLKYKKEGKLRAQHVIEEMYNLAGSDVIYTTDVGQHQMWAAQFIKINSPRNWISSGGAGTMGFGFPSAIGAQMACPDRKVVTIVGDGSFQMTLSELSTAVVNKLPIKILLLNNRYLGMVRQWQNLFYENRLTGVDLEGNPDFLKLASAYGAKGFRIRRSSDVRKVLKEALQYNAGPCLIDAVVEQHDNVFPMVPSGANLDKMILGFPQKRKELE
ncbi:MAG: biosynthetic-type acetolactate synthase large subunit [Spirochaetaceae bacterium]|nr:biosynthetic-type acetolactate synthase large subunit [Spirochaetaceae bacterium]